MYRIVRTGVSHKQTLSIVKQLGEKYNETVKKWKKVIEMRTVDNYPLASHDSDSSWCPESSDSEFEIEQFSTTGKTAFYVGMINLHN